MQIPCHVFTHLSNLFEFWPLLPSTTSVTGSSSLIPLRPLLFFDNLQRARTTVSDSHCSLFGNFPPWKFIVVAFLVLVFVGADDAVSDSGLLASELLSAGGPLGAVIICVVVYSS